MTDGSAGDADYATIGMRYTTYRQPEPEFAAAIERALGDARTVLNVGAGAAPTSRAIARSRRWSRRRRCAHSGRAIWPWRSMR
ncbi:MAG: hypothetical protein NVV57_02975 [Demequina sp.]|nr:hypothetical protein [Demequina sp.]